MAPQPGPPTKPAPVLVIDDEIEGSAATVSKLAEVGYATTAESDGERCSGSCGPR